jgi:hypothetical protein
VTWVDILKALVLAVGAFADWLRNRQALESASAELIASHLQSALDEITRAENARNTVGRDMERAPERLRDDDGYRRGD